MNDVVIAPSILAADCGRLNEEIKEVEKETSFLHIDVMDGHYVPNLTFGVPIVESIRKATNMVFDVHLMVTNPERHFEPFAKAGADSITFHYEVMPGGNSEYPNAYYASDIDDEGKTAEETSAAAVKEAFAASDSEPAADAVYGGEIALYDVDEKTAACIMAIISDEKAGR